MLTHFTIDGKRPHFQETRPCKVLNRSSSIIISSNSSIISFYLTHHLKNNTYLWTISSICPSCKLDPPIDRSTKTENSVLLSSTYIPRLIWRIKINNIKNLKNGYNLWNLSNSCALKKAVWIVKCGWAYISAINSKMDLHVDDLQSSWNNDFNNPNKLKKWSLLLEVSYFIIQEQTTVCKHNSFSNSIPAGKRGKLGLEHQWWI